MDSSSKFFFAFLCKVCVDWMLNADKNFISNVIKLPHKKLGNMRGAIPHRSAG